MLKGHLPRVIYHQVYYHTKKNVDTTEAVVSQTGNRYVELCNPLILPYIPTLEPAF